MLRRLTASLLACAISIPCADAQQRTRFYFQSALGLQSTRIVDRQFSGAPNSNRSTGLAAAFSVGLRLARPFGLDLSTRFTSNFARNDTFEVLAWGLGLVA